jgi:hypothetical protein
MHRIFAILFLLVVACQSSSHEKSEKIDDGDSKGNLSSGKIGNLGDINPSWIQVVNDSYLLLVDQFADPAITLYTLPDFKKVATTAKLGKGPFEFITPKLEGNPFIENDSTFIYVSDYNAHILYKLNITRLINGTGKEFTKIDDIHHDLVMGWLDLYPIDNRFILGTSFNNRGRVFRWDRVAGTVKYIPNFPAPTVPVPRDQIGNFYYSFSAYNPKRKIMASALQLFNEVDFFDDTAQLVRSVQFNDVSRGQPLLRTDGYPYPDETKFYFSRAYGTDRFLYLMAEDRRVMNRLSSGLAFYLKLFDWDGNYLGKWKLERFNLGAFAVCERYQKIYAINYGPDMESYPIITYDLSNLINLVKGRN